MYTLSWLPNICYNLYFIYLCYSLQRLKDASDGDTYIVSVSWCPNIRVRHIIIVAQYRGYINLHFVYSSVVLKKANRSVLPRNEVFRNRVSNRSIELRNEVFFLHINVRNIRSSFETAVFYFNVQNLLG